MRDLGQGALHRSENRESIRQRLRRGSLHSLVALQEAINRFMTEHNQDSRPFV